jgi:predicted nucleic acid-binding protein
MALALLDTNVLVHAAYRDTPFHDSAARLVARGLRERGSFCISPQNLIEFAAVVTRKHLVITPLNPEELQRMVKTLYESRRLAKIYPKRGTAIRAVRDGAALGFTGPQWYDVYLAATMRDSAIESIVTEDLETFRKIPFVTALSIGEAKP